MIMIMKMNRVGERFEANALAVVAVLMVSLFCFVHPLRAKVVFETESAYHHIIVEDKGDTRILRFDNSYQTMIDLKDPDRACFLYTDYLHLGLAFKPDVKKTLIVGLGGGAVPMKFRRDYSDMRIDVVELDPVVKKVAEKYFGFKEDEMLKVFISDGRQFLRRTKSVYDLIILDAYHGSKYGISLPFHLATKEFFDIVYNRLSDTGVMEFNLIGTLEGRRSKTTRSILKTINSVFGNFYPFPVEYQRSPWVAQGRNIIVIATKDKKSLSKADLIARAQVLSSKLIKVQRIAEYAADLYEKNIPLRDVRLFTDDYAPVEFIRP